mmetsp:Transcript_13889/g.20836  ORF Transcript_13889/g.20836 Transcript_13889/m.20836 type:complete len:224 (-) Transcript_13889:807-1478(-)
MREAHAGRGEVGSKGHDRPQHELILARRGELARVLEESLQGWNQLRQLDQLGAEALGSTRVRECARGGLESGARANALGVRQREQCGEQGVVRHRLLLRVRGRVDEHVELLPPVLAVEEVGEAACGLLLHSVDRPLQDDTQRLEDARGHEHGGERAVRREVGERPRRLQAAAVVARLGDEEKEGNNITPGDKDGGQSDLPCDCRQRPRHLLPATLGRGVAKHF